MTSTEFDPNETPAEILDLYDALPSPSRTPATEQNEPVTGI